MRKIFIILVVLSVFLSITGCGRAISKAVRAKVSEDIALGMVKETPQLSRNKMVLWGGVIVKATNQREGTLVEIVEKPISYQGRPQKTDRSQGRFLALYKGYLDSAIYKEGREVTVAGKIVGERALPLDEITYTYPLIHIEEIHLWPPRIEKEVYYFRNYRFPPYWDYPYGW
jgi:outer membrane lipoprotein